VSAGTALAWTSPLEKQLNNETIPAVEKDEREWKKPFLIYCRQSISLLN
jgi:hypothetical protein